jgi:ABC-2 type transport system ATP-binding protein
MNEQWLAELADVRKRFGATVALDGVDLRVGAGELLALLGPNGAGKTTAISLLLGLERPDSGSALLLGQSPLCLEARRQVGVMMQEVALAPELRVREHVDLVASYYPDPLAPDAALDLTHTRAIASRLYGKLSGGQKRQAQFAMAVCGRPRLLFLDEPTVGLDVQARELMWTTLRRLVADGCAIVLTTHYLEEAEALADRVVVLGQGRVMAAGTVDEMRALVVRKQVRCRTQLTAAEVRSWPGVDKVEGEDHHLVVSGRDAEAIVRRLLAADESLSELEIRRAGLAQAFAELTKERPQ